MDYACLPGRPPALLTRMHKQPETVLAFAEELLSEDALRLVCMYCIVVQYYYSISMPHTLWIKKSLPASEFIFQKPVARSRPHHVCLSSSSSIQVYIPKCAYTHTTTVKTCCQCFCSSLQSNLKTDFSLLPNIITHCLTRVCLSVLHYALLFWYVVYVAKILSK